MAKVYIKIDDNKNIIEIGSSVFIKDPTGYIEMAEGSGDHFVHAQNNYLAGPLFDEQGNPRYKYIDGQIMSLDETEETPYNNKFPWDGQN